MRSGPKSSSTNGGLAFVAFLTILLISLKLLDEISWSWWWVLSPIWLGAIVAFAIVALALVFLRD
ncbi:MAG TPA: hypothetical protein VIU14_16760 [Mesorhizobium sp.]|jgi:hypothetical protein